MAAGTDIKRAAPRLVDLQRRRVANPAGQLIAETWFNGAASKSPFLGVRSLCGTVIGSTPEFTYVYLDNVEEQEEPKR